MRTPGMLKGRTVTIVTPDYDRKIRTSFDHPPIFMRNMDWSAWIDGTEESGPFGLGETELDAIADLVDSLRFAG